MHRFFIKRTLTTNQILKKTSEELADTTKKCTEVTPKKQSKYTHTILLPQTKFPVQLNGKARIDTDKHLTEVSRYISFYLLIGLFFHLFKHLFL